tara:strand:- start:20983 stop:21198 length:216 start_codon:yes stop_codon:yes gene_type:complete
MKHRKYIIQGLRIDVTEFKPKTSYEVFIEDLDDDESGVLLKFQSGAKSIHDLNELINMLTEIRRELYHEGN